MKKKIISFGCLLFSFGLFVSLAAGVASRTNIVEVKASAADDSYYYIVGDFAYETSNSEYKSLGSWKVNYDATQRALAGVQNHHSKIYTLTGGYYKSGNNWIGYEDNFKFFDITAEWSDEINFSNVQGSAKKYFKDFGGGNIAVNKAAFHSGNNDGAKLTYSVRPDVTANSRTLTIENVYYYAGTRNGDWTHPTAELFQLVENGPSILMSFGAGEEFKFSNYDRNEGRESAYYNTLDFSALDGSAKSYFKEAQEKNGNIKCYNKGEYLVRVSDSKLIIDVPQFCYHGTATSWAEDSAHPITIGGDPVEFTFAKDEQFKLAPKGVSDWGSVELNWNNLTGSVETIDGVDYRSYRCFKMGTGTDNLNIICRKAGTYLVSVNADKQITIVASNQDQTNRYYALDLNGDLFTGDQKSPHAHLFINDSLNPQISTAWPGYDMSKVSETNNIFAVDAWVDLDTIVFNNGTTGTTDLSLTGNVNKVLILSWAYDQEANKWTSSTWLSLDAAKFIDSYMKFETAHEDNKGSGQCKTAGWYSSAKTAFNALSEDLREEILSYELVNARLSAWATANGDTIDNSGLLSSNSVLFRLGTNLLGNNYLLLLVVGGVVIAGVVFTLSLRKRKQH